MKKPKKSLGQNFLIDQNISNKIVNLVNDINCNIIEVGPGTVLTKLNKNINSDIICTNFNKLQSII